MLIATGLLVIAVLLGSQASAEVPFEPIIKVGEIQSIVHPDTGPTVLECNNQEWAGDPRFFWRTPYRGYSIYAQKFSVDFPRAVSIVDFMMYDFGSDGISVVGNDDVYITVYSDTNGFPAYVLGQDTVAAGSYGFLPAWTTVDMSRLGIVVDSDYYIGLSTSATPASGDCEAFLSDEKTEATNRTFVYTEGLGWSTVEQEYDISIDFLVAVQTCRERISSVSPSANQLQVFNRPTISASFSSPVDAATINDQSFLVYGQQSGYCRGRVSYDEATNSAIFRPARDFAAGELVTITVKDNLRTAIGTPIQPHSWSFTSSTRRGRALLETSISYEIGDGPNSVTVADFDNDGDMDIAVSCGIDSTIGLLENIGDGAFTRLSSITVPPVVRSIRAADFNGDGFMDLVTNQATILLGNGDMTFSDPVTYLTGFQRFQTIPVDVDNDGDYDLVSINGYNRIVTVLFNDGAAYFNMLQTYVAGPLPVAVAAGDLNGDGFPELIVANQNANYLSIFYNKGDGTFHSEIWSYTKPRANSIALTDYDSDGHLDIVVGHKGGTSADAITISLNDGNGIVTLAHSLAVGINCLYVTLPDFDGDGLTDIITSCTDGDHVLVLSNFEGEDVIQIGDYPVGGFPSELAHADLDNDGDIDIVVPNQFTDDVTIMFNSICVDSDRDGFGDPGHGGNECPQDNCPSVANSDQSDYDSDGIGDACDDCSNFAPEIERPRATQYVMEGDSFRYYPAITDADNDSHTIQYSALPDWCQIVGDTVVGTAPADIQLQQVSLTVQDECNSVELSFDVQPFVCGDVSGDGNGPDIADLTALAEYMFRGGPRPAVLAAADVDRSGFVDVADLTAIIGYVFLGNPRPTCR